MEVTHVLPELRRKLGNVVGADPTCRAAEYTKWHAPLVVGHIRCARDPDTELARWVLEGAPVGVAQPVSDGGIFPHCDKEARNPAELNRLCQYY